MSWEVSQISAYALLGSFRLEADINSKTFACHVCGEKREAGLMELHYSIHSRPTETAEESAVCDFTDQPEV
jgi:hypothetical protein